MRLLEEAHGFSVHPLLLEGPSGRTTDTTAATSLRVESSSSQRGCSCKGRVSSGHATHQGDKVALGCKRRFLLPLLSVLLLRLLLACRFWCFFEAVVPVAAADASPFHYRRKWKGPRLHLPPEGPNDVQLGGPHTGAGPSSSFWGPLSESSSDSAGYFFEGSAGLGGSRQSSRGPPLISQLRELAIQLQEGMRKASNALHQIKQFEGEGATAAATSSLSSMQADPTGPSGSEREGSPTMADALSALNSTLQRLLSEFTRGLSLLFTSEAQDQAGADTVDTPTSINGRGALKSSGLGALDAAGGGGGPPTALGQAQLSGGPSTQEVRRLAQHLLYKLMPFDPTYHVLIKFYGVPTTPNRLTRALPSSVNRLWVSVLTRSFPSVYSTLARRRVFMLASKVKKEQLLRGGARRKRTLQEAAAGWFVSTHRVTMLGFCYSEQAQPVHPCSGNIAAGLDVATVQSLRSVLLENEALANFRLSGLGDLSRVAVLGRENELAAQRVVRLLLAEPSLLFKGHNTMASVLMVVPQYWGVRGGPPLEQGPSLLSHVPDFPKLGTAGLGGGVKGNPTTCGDGKGVPCPLMSEGGGLGGGPLCVDETPSSSFVGGLTGWKEEETGDPNVHLLIDMPGEGAGLDIRNFPQQIVQLISADADEQNATSHYYPLDDHSPQDSIILNSSSGEMPSPTRKFIDANRIILQGTCRRVVSPTGASTLLKTREFGVKLSVQQRRTVEMQLPESRILVHIEILGVSLSTQPADPPPPNLPLDYFVGPRFLSEHRELAPYTAVDAANLIRLRIGDQSRHVWGNARVVLWEADHNQQEMDTKGALQEEGQPGKSDYQTWKILVAVLVPSFVVGALVVISWHSTSICRCVGSGPTGNDADTSAASPPTEGLAAGANEKSFTQREAA